MKPSSSTTNARQQVRGKRTADLTPSLRDAFRLVLHHKLPIVLLVLFVGCVSALVVTLFVKPTYRASTTLLIEAAKPNIVAIDEVSEGPNKNREYFQTQIELLRSATVAQRVAKALDLAAHPAFAAAVAAARGRDEQVMSRVVEAIQLKLSVEALRLSQLVRVSFESDDPVLAARIVNAVAQTYITVDTESRADATRQAHATLGDRLRELRSALDQSERELQSYRETERVVDSRRPERGQGGNTIYGEVSRRLLEARLKRQELEQAYRQMASADRRQLESAPAIARNAGVLRAREIEAQARRKLEEVSQNFGPSHPTYQSAASDARTAQEELARQIAAAIETARKDYEAALAVERSIEDNRSTSQGNVLDTERKLIRLAQLEGEVETNRQLYERFLARSKETAAARDIVAVPARIVEQAPVPHQPVAPNKMLTVLGTMLATLIVVAVTLVARARRDDSAKTAEQLGDALGEPVVSVVPLHVPADGSEQGLALARIAIDDAGALYAESVRTVGTALTLLGLDSGQRGQVVAITSTIGAEGKSTFAANLALSESSQRRTLLIEGDMRRPALAKMLGLAEGAPGLSEFLVGKARFADVLQRVPGTELGVVACGRVPSNPLGRLSPRRFGKAIAALRKHYALIVIDCPPVELVPDALLLGKQADGMLYLVRSQSTSLTLAQRGLDKLRRAGLAVYGLVLTHHDHERARSVYGERSVVDDYAGYRPGGDVGAGAPTRMFAEANTDGAPAPSRASNGASGPRRRPPTGGIERPAAA